MRMRHKKWSMPELLGSGYYVEEPEALRGKWKEAFARSQPLFHCPPLLLGTVKKNNK